MEQQTEPIACMTAFQFAGRLVTKVSLTPTGSIEQQKAYVWHILVLQEKGKPVQGVIFNGKGNIIGKADNISCTQDEFSFSNDHWLGEALTYKFKRRANDPYELWTGTATGTMYADWIGKSPVTFSRCAIKPIDATQMAMLIVPGLVE